MCNSDCYSHELSRITPKRITTCKLVSPCSWWTFSTPVVKDRTITSLSILYFRVVNRPGKRGNLELSGNSAAFEKNVRKFHENGKKLGKNEGILVMWNEWCVNCFQLSFIFAFTKQLLSHFVSHLFRSLALIDTELHLTVKKFYLWDCC